MKNRELLERLGFAGGESNPFYLEFDPERPEPPAEFFETEVTRALKEPYQAYRSAVLKALAEAENPPPKVTLGLAKEALNPLGRLLAGLPEADELQGLGRFLLDWAGNGFDEFPDSEIEQNVLAKVSADADLFFNDLMKELKGFGFEFGGKTEFDVWGYRNRLEGKLSGWFKEETLERMRKELPAKVGEAAAKLYFEAARYSYVEDLLDNANDHESAWRLMGLLKKARSAKYGQLLLCIVADEMGDFADEASYLEADDLAGEVDAKLLQEANPLINARYDDWDEDDYLHDEAAGLQRAIRDWYERELELGYARRLEELAHRYEFDGSFLDCEEQGRLQAA